MVLCLLVLANLNLEVVRFSKNCNSRKKGCTSLHVMHFEPEKHVVLHISITDVMETARTVQTIGNLSSVAPKLQWQHYKDRLQFFLEWWHAPNNGKSKPRVISLQGTNLTLVEGKTDMESHKEELWLEGSQDAPPMQDNLSTLYSKFYSKQPDAHNMGVKNEGNKKKTSLLSLLSASLQPHGSGNLRTTWDWTCRSSKLPCFCAKDLLTSGLSTSQPTGPHRWHRMDLCQPTENDLLSSTTKSVKKEGWKQQLFTWPCNNLQGH